MPKIRVKDLISFVKEGSKGHFFSVRFVKRTNREVRDMTARYGVRKYVTGAGAAYDFEEKGLLCVFTGPQDASPNQYRTIPVESVIHIKINGVVYEVEKEL